MTGYLRVELSAALVTIALATGGFLSRSYVVGFFATLAAAVAATLVLARALDRGEPHR